MPFYERYKASRPHEAETCRRLCALGWAADFYGTSAQEEPLRGLIHNLDSVIRYAPDIVAVRFHGGRWHAAIIDAKAGRDDTDNFCAAVAAVDGIVAHSKFWGVPAWMVFGKDFQVVWAGRLQIRNWVKHVPKEKLTRDGTGDPMYMIEKKWGHPMDRVFRRPIYPPPWPDPSQPATPPQLDLPPPPTLFDGHEPPPSKEGLPD